VPDAALTEVQAGDVPRRDNTAYDTSGDRPGDLSRSSQRRHHDRSAAALSHAAAIEKLERGR
jgi:hypothetical protein